MEPQDMQGNIASLGAARSRREDEEDRVEAVTVVYRDGIEALVNAFENPGAAESRAFFVRLGSAAARRLYINAAKAGMLDE